MKLIRLYREDVVTITPCYYCKIPIRTVGDPTGLNNVCKNCTHKEEWNNGC